MRFYFAARYSRAGELRGYADQLRSLGHEVTSRWLEGGHEIAREGTTEADHRERARFATEDWADLMRAQVVVSFTETPRSTPNRGGRHVEFGVALATHKRCVVIGPRENVFHCLPTVDVYETWEQYLGGGTDAGPVA
jgi:hypothetical protein